MYITITKENYEVFFTFNCCRRPLIGLIQFQINLSKLFTDILYF